MGESFDVGVPAWLLAVAFNIKCGAFFNNPPSLPIYLHAFPSSRSLRLLFRPGPYMLALPDWMLLSDYTTSSPVSFLADVPRAWSRYGLHCGSLGFRSAGPR